MTRLGPSLVALGVLFGSFAVAAQQAPPARRGAAAPAPTSPSSPSSTTPASPSAASSIEERAYLIPRAQLETLTKQLEASAQPAASAPRGRFAGVTGALRGALTGNEHREEAARRLVRTEASRASVNGARTVAVIIGSDADRAKVRESLAGVTRPVVLLFVDDSVRDDASDNTALKGGLTDKATGAATNLWVFLPRPGAAADRAPERTLSSRIITDKIWAGVFTGEGDLDAAKSFAGSGAPAGGSAPAAAAPSAVAPPTATSAGGIAVGDVVGPKIANIKVLAQPADNAKEVATLARTDELVVIAGEKNGYINVQGASAAGWVKLVLVAKR